MVVLIGADCAARGVRRLEEALGDAVTALPRLRTTTHSCECPPALYQRATYSVLLFYVLSCCSVRAAVERMQAVFVPRTLAAALVFCLFSYAKTFAMPRGLRIAPPRERALAELVGKD